MSNKCVNCSTSVGCSCKLIEGKYCSLTCKQEYENKTNSLYELSDSKVSVRSDNKLVISPN